MKFPKKLNILYVGTLPPHTGGTAILGSQLLIGLTRLGHEVRAVAPITDEKLRSGDTFADNHPEIGVTRILVPYFESSPDIPPPDKYRKIEGEQIQKVMTALIVDQRPDIIIIGRETFVWHVPDLADVYCIPCVLLIQGATTLGILKHTIPEDMARKMLEMYRKTNLMIVVAKHLEKTLQQLRLGNIKVIQNAIDVHQFFPRSKDENLLHKLKIKKNDIVVVHVSNLKSLKRPLDLVYSAKKTLQQNSRLVYVIVGDGPMRKDMEETCRQKNIFHKFRFIGWIDYHYIPNYINLADIVVMPSEAEARALVYLETQACGRLLLASDIPAAQEVIVNGKTGLLFTKGDIDDLTAKTLLAASNPKLRAEIGLKARETVQFYPLCDLVNAYESTLKDVVQQYRARQSFLSYT